MMRRFTAVLTACAVALCAAPALAESPIAGITIGESVTAAAKDLGPPSSVESTDTVNRFTFATAVAYVDGDATIRAVDTATGSFSVDIDGKPHTFTIGTFTTAEADAQLSSYAEYASDTLRSYRLPPSRELALIFDKATQKLTRIIYGERGPIARLGVLPGDNLLNAVPYKAPRVRTTAIAGTTGTRLTVVRIAVDRGGNPTSIDVVVPSADPAWDATLAQRMKDDRFWAAQLGGRNIGATVFRALRH
jgi:hypothetical protein